VNPLSYLRRWHRPVDDGPAVVQLGDAPEGGVLVPTALDELGEPCSWVACEPDASDEWDVRLWGPPS
jgi:hypothetical protein